MCLVGDRPEHAIRFPIADLLAEAHTIYSVSDIVSNIVVPAWTLVHNSMDNNCRVRRRLNVAAVTEVTNHYC